MFINWKQKEVNLKIVYYGAALCGKTTNLEQIHNRIDPKLRSDLVSLKTREDRTIFFDFMQIELNEIKGLKPKFNLYTVPGQVYYLASRKLVLQGADGVVFVVDSHADRLSENVDTLQNLYGNLRELGVDHAQIPIVFQFNKRDLPQALSVETLRGELGCNGHLQVEAVASEGVGVFETLKPAIRSVMENVMRKF